MIAMNPRAYLLLSLFALPGLALAADAGIRLDTRSAAGAPAMAKAPASGRR